MCIIIHHQEHNHIPDRWIEEFWRRNSDGWGIMYHDEDGSPKAIKGLDLKAFKKAYKKIAKLSIEFFIHFRMRTHGDVNVDQCHPYKTNNGYLIHNGIIDIKQHLGEHLSDTHHFVEAIWNPLSLTLTPGSENFDRLIEGFIGGNNRIVAALPNFEFVTINYDSWHLIKSLDLMVSNTYAWKDIDYVAPKPSYKPAKALPKVSNQWMDQYSSQDEYLPQDDYPWMDSTMPRDTSSDSYYTVYDAIVDSLPNMKQREIETLLAKEPMIMAEIIYNEIVPFINS
jgi:hypothetical protein